MEGQILNFGHSDRGTLFVTDYGTFISGGGDECRMTDKDEGVHNRQKHGDIISGRSLSRNKLSHKYKLEEICCWRL